MKYVKQMGTTTTAMSNIFFTSDTHFGHKRIPEMGGRPFWRGDEPDIEAMDEHLIEQWNSTVGPRQVVYHLGDFSFYNDVEKSQEILNRLNGQIKFLKGNHDYSKQIQQVLGYEPPGYMEVKHNKEKIVLCHYAMRTWNRSHRGSMMLHGHSHGDLDFVDGVFTPFGRTMDVGVDAAARHGLGYRPFSYEEVVEILQGTEPVNHHVPRH